MIKQKNVIYFALAVKIFVINNKITKDLSNLQWFTQINIDKVFNLN